MKTNEIYFKSIHDFLRVFANEQDCINHLEQIRWNGTIVSPFDATSKVYKCSGNKFKCKNTGKYFNAKTGTIFESSNIKLMKWFLALYVFSSHKKGISSIQLSKDIDVTQKSAWFMLHRLRFAFGNQSNDKLNGTVEADCTYIGGKTKFKSKSKQISDNAKGTGTVNKTAVFGMVERGGNVVAGVINLEDQKTIRPLIRRWVEVGSNLMSDGHGAYKNIKGLKHSFVSHEKHEYVRGNIHTGHIDGFWSQFKRGIVGIYHQISPKHTNSYAQEFALRHNTRELSTSTRFDLILESMICRLTYKTLTAK